jgi:hypothetical protein
LPLCCRPTTLAKGVDLSAPSATRMLLATMQTRSRSLGKKQSYALDEQAF